LVVGRTLHRGPARTLYPGTAGLLQSAGPHERQRLQKLLEVASQDRTLELLEFLEYTLSISTRPGSEVLRRLQRVHYSPAPSGRALLWALGDRLETLQLAETALGKLEERTRLERKVLPQ